MHPSRRLILCHPPARRCTRRLASPLPQNGGSGAFRRCQLGALLALPTGCRFAGRTRPLLLCLHSRLLGCCKRGIERRLGSRCRILIGGAGRSCRRGGQVCVAARLRSMRSWVGECLTRVQAFWPGHPSTLRRPAHAGLHVAKNRQDGESQPTSIAI